MFGRRTADPGKKAPPPPPPADVWAPVRKMDDALEAVLRLFTRELERAGQDCGGLAVRGPVPDAVATLLSDCIVYQGANGMEYLTLGLTRDFKAFSYPPHCRLFFILNGALLLEDPVSSELRGQITIGQVPRPFVDAHMMKRWIKYIQPTGKAIAAGDGDAAQAIVDSLRREMAEVVQQTPAWISQRFDLRECAVEWCSGFPGTIGRPLSPDVKKINNLPMSDFVEQTLTKFLVEMQARR
jgi:hypothetical protein